MSAILALDPALSCGWAHSSGISGTWDLRAANPGRSLAALESHLLRMHAQHGFALLAYEAASYGASGGRRGVQWGAIVSHCRMQGVIELVAAKLDVQARSYHIATIKKHATGNGRAKKEQMIRAAKTLLGRSVRSSDEADAIWICELAASDCRQRVEKRRARRRTKEPRLF